MKIRELWILALAAGLLAWQLLLPGFIGMANNGDFAKIAGRLCIGGLDDGTYYFRYFRSNYVRDAKYCYEAHFPSSEHEIAWVASAVEQRVADPARFDIRWLGALHAIGWLAAFTFLIVAIRPLYDTPWWWAAAAASILIFFDVTYVSYLNSFYTDVAALIGGFGMVATLPLLPKQRQWVPVFGAAAFLYVASKPQHGLLVLIPASALAIIAWRSRKAAPTIFAGGLIVGALCVILSSDEANGALPRFSLIFSKLLPSSTSPEQDARELGLIPADMQYVGKHAFQPDSPTRDLAWVHAFCRRNTAGTILRFYLRHPSVPFHLLRDVLYKEAWQIRPANLSNFRREDGHPAWAHSSRMALWTAFRSRLFVLWPAHMILLYSLALIGGLWKRNWTILFAASLGAGEFAIASLGDVLETFRHLLLFHFFTDAVIFFALYELFRAASRLIPVK